MVIVLGGTSILALFAGPSYWLTCISDALSCALWATAVFAMLWAAKRTRGRTRIFWIAFAAGAFLASMNLGAWGYYDVIVRRNVPDPFWADIPLFLQPIPMMAAVALQPHRGRQTPKLYVGSLNFLILLLWWIYLYSFRIFPHEYVVFNAEAFNRYYNILYILELIILLGALGWSWISTTGGWRKLYVQLFLSTTLYVLAFQALNAALLRGSYYPGSFYDVLNNAPTCFFIAIAFSFGNWEERNNEVVETPISLRWTAVWSVLSALAVISVPIMGFWTLAQVDEPPALQHFRLAVTLIASAALAFCVFLRQRFMDQRLTGLVAKSQETLDHLQRVQSELVSTERLGSLGQLVAGAAHEINNPLTAVLGYADLLATNSSLSAEQTSLASKVVQEARRARSLVSDLLVFARNAPANKAQLDLVSLVQRAVKTDAQSADRPNVQMIAKLSTPVPRVWGSTHELFQAFQQLFSGLADLMEPLGGGTVLIRTSANENHVNLEVSCLDRAGRPLPPDVSPCLASVRDTCPLRFRVVQATIENHSGRMFAPDPGRVIVSLPSIAEIAASASANS